MVSSFPRKRESIPGSDMDKQLAVYLMASKRNGTLYIGVTSDLKRGVWEHKNDVVEGFTKKYRVHTLVYFELHGDMYVAITREKQLKKWNRAWKIEWIERANPAGGICGMSCEGAFASRWISTAHKPGMDSRLRGDDGVKCNVPGFALT